MQKELERRKKIVEGYYSLHELDSLKNIYDTFGKEIKRLYYFDPITESGARNRLAIQLLKEERMEIKSKYDSMYCNVEKWLQDAFIKEKDTAKLKIFTEYYREISNTNLQMVINRIYPPFSVKSKTDNDKRSNQYYASNLRQSLESAFRRLVEGR